MQLNPKKCVKAVKKSASAQFFKLYTTFTPIEKIIVDFILLGAI